MISTKHIALTLLLSIALGGVGCQHTSPYDYSNRNGAAEARRDIRRGTPKIKASGFPAPDREAYARLLKERLGITLETVAAYVVTSDLSEYADDYNEIIVAYIAEKFGPQTLDNLHKEAIAATPGAASFYLDAKDIKKADPPSALTPVKDKPGFFSIPGENSGVIDIRGIPSGTEVKSPYSNKIYRIA